MHDTIDRETLAMLADGAARFRAERYRPEQRRRWLVGDPGYSVEAWRAYASFGWLAVPLPDAFGGFGDDPRGTAAIMEYVGAALALEPVLAGPVNCGRLLARSEAAVARDGLAEIAAGEKFYALAHGESPEDGSFGAIEGTWRDGRLDATKTVVLHGDVADRLLVTARDASGALVVVRVDASDPGVSVTPYPLIDGRGAATVTLTAAGGVPVPLDDTHASVEATLDEARVALCSEALGAIRALNDHTLAYLKTRRQFGQPIGANQALQHRMVECFMLQEELGAVIEAAQRALRGPGAERARTVSGAAAHAADAARHCAHEAVQMHGGMGITEELPVSHYFRRLMVTARLLGDREQHLRRFSGAAPSTEVST